MRRLAIFILLLVIFSGCSKTEDYGLQAYAQKDYVNAFVLAEKGCKDKNGEACYILGNIYLTNLLSNVKLLPNPIFNLKSSTFFEL